MFEKSVYADKCGKNLWLLSLFTCFFTASIAQGSPVITNGEAYNAESIMPELDSLHRDNDFVLAFMIKSSWVNLSDFVILTKNGTKLRAYKYVIQRHPHLTLFSLSEDRLTELWDAFARNDLFYIDNEIRPGSNCPVDTIKKDGKEYYKPRYSISDASSYQFLLLTKERMKMLVYYAPDFYEKFCPGSTERQKVINAASVLLPLLK